MKYADHVVIGGGLAGTAVAWQLARRGAGSVRLLEREPSLGTQATAQNAAMIRRLVEDEAIAALAREGARLLDDPPDDLAAALSERLGSTPAIRKCGSILVAQSAAGRSGLETMCEAGGAAGVGAELVEPAAVAEMVPGIDATKISGGVFCASDGITDPHALVHALAAAAERAGAQISTGVRAKGARIERGRLVGVETDRGTIPCGAAIDAAGAWAGALAREIGTRPPPLRPHRRHIAVTAPIEGAQGWPILWDVERGFYVRPESGRVMMSGCDQEPFRACSPPTDSAFLGPMAAKAQILFPSIDFPIARSWAGLRTFPPDGRFLLGPDPHIEGLYWAAGLGGHGVTAAGAVGRWAAGAIVGEEPSGLAWHSPKRWAEAGQLSS